MKKGDAVPTAGSLPPGGYPGQQVANPIYNSIAGMPQKPAGNVHQMSTLQHFMNRPAGTAVMPIEEAHMLTQGASYAQQTTTTLMDQTKQALAIASEVQTMSHTCMQGHVDKPALVLDRATTLLQEAGRIINGVLNTLKPICETTLVAAQRAEDGAQFLCSNPATKPHVQARAEHAVKHARESRDFAGRCVCKIAVALDQHHAMYGSQSVSGDVAQVVLAATACNEACRYAMFGARLLQASTETILDIQVTGS